MNHKGSYANVGPEEKVVVDYSVYPDVEHGDHFEDDFDRADYVHRICAERLRRAALSRHRRDVPHVARRIRSLPDS
jgi:hypothetical protein